MTSTSSTDGTPFKGKQLATISEADESGGRAVSGGSPQASNDFSYCSWCKTPRTGVAFHNVVGCREFRRLESEQRNLFIREQKLCFSCLMRNHWSTGCPTPPPPCLDSNRTHSGLLSCNFLINPSTTSYPFQGAIDSSYHKPSYSRTCPVVLFHHTDPSKKIEGLAIIDEGSAISLISGVALSGLVVPSEYFSTLPLVVTTVDRTMPLRKQRAVRGLCISPLRYPTACTEISRCVEWDNLPRTLDEVATPDEVAQIEEFKHLKKLFPKVNPDWKHSGVVGS